MFARSFSTATVVVALCSVLNAQQVTFRGKVEDVQGTNNEFFVDCTATSLTSAIDLNPFVGQQTEITGNWNGSFADPVVDVTALTIVPETFEIGGGAKIGGELRFHTTSDPGNFAIFYGSLGNGFLNLKSTGVFFLDITAFTRVGSGRVGGDGNLEISIDLPNDPALDGLEVFGQSLVLSSGNASLTNPDCKTITS